MQVGLGWEGGGGGTTIIRINWVFVTNAKPEHVSGERLFLVIWIVVWEGLFIGGVSLFMFSHNEFTYIDNII
jgi:hypothetical protein